MNFFLIFWIQNGNILKNPKSQILLSLSQRLGYILDISLHSLPSILFFTPSTKASISF